MVKLSEKEIGSRKIYIKEFESIKDFYEHCRTAPINTKCFTRDRAAKGEYSFCKTYSYNQAEELLLNGWEEGSKKLTTKLNIANSKVQSREVKRAIFDIVGFQASVPRYLQGIPTNMVNKKTVKQKQKVVTIIKGINYAGMVSPETIMEDSVKFLQIVQAIEAQGIRVNVDVLSLAIQGSEESYIRMPIKRSSERLNISKMSFPLIHPSFLRRFIFRARETDMRLKDTSWGYGYGRPAEEQFVKRLLNPGEYFIAPLISEKAALEAITNIGSVNK